jgi:hypothetical protein
MHEKIPHQTMRDPDGLRRAMIASGQPAADLAADTGPRWTAEQLQRDYRVIGFAAPYVVVVRRADEVTGTLEFATEDGERAYFSFEPA